MVPFMPRDTDCTISLAAPSYTACVELSSSKMRSYVKKVPLPSGSGLPPGDVCLFYFAMMFEQQAAHEKRRETSATRVPVGKQQTTGG